MPGPQLISEYTAPAVRVGARVTCLFRDRACVVTSITAAPVPWPRVQPCEQRGGCGLLVTAELVTAIRTESAAALKYHFGASTTTVWKWRKAFGVGGRATTPGSASAIRAAAQKGADAVKAKEWTDAELNGKAATSKRLGLRLVGRWTVGGWTAGEVTLLAGRTDAEVAARTGRTLDAVRLKRRAVGKKLKPRPVCDTRK